MLPYLHPFSPHLCFLSPLTLNLLNTENAKYFGPKVPFFDNCLDFFYYNNFPDFSYQKSYSYGLLSSLQDHYLAQNYKINNVSYSKNQLVFNLPSQTTTQDYLSNNLQGNQIPSTSIQFPKSRNSRRNIKEELINKIFLSTISNSEDGNNNEMQNQSKKPISLNGRDSKDLLNNIQSYFIDVKTHKNHKSELKETNKSLIRARNLSEDYGSDRELGINSPIMSKQRKKMKEKDLSPELNEPKAFIKNAGNKSEIIKLVNMKNMIQKGTSNDHYAEIISPGSKKDNNSSFSNKSIFDLSPNPFASAVQKVELKFEQQRNLFSDEKFSEND